jgi:hypothetical protein
MVDHIEVHFNRMGLGGGTLVIVAVGTEVYGATDLEPVNALHVAAKRAADDLALRGQQVDPAEIVEYGLRSLPTSC